MSDVLGRCWWQAISPWYIIVVSTRITTLQPVPGLNVGSIAAAEVQMCYGTCTNQRISFCPVLRGHWLPTAAWVNPGGALCTRTQAIFDGAGRSCRVSRAVWTVLLLYKLVAPRKRNESQVLKPVQWASTVYVRQAQCTDPSIATSSTQRVFGEEHV